MINKRPPNPTADAFRKTVAAVRKSDATTHGLADAAAEVLDVVAMLGAAGVFDLALDFPPNLDDRFADLDDALQKVLAGVLAPEVIENRTKHVERVLASAAAVLADKSRPEDLVKRTALLAEHLIRSLDVADMSPRVFRDLVAVGQSFDSIVEAEQRRSATEAVHAAGRLARVIKAVTEGLNPAAGKFDGLDARELITAVDAQVARNRRGELADHDLLDEVASRLLPFADADQQRAGLAGLADLAAEVVQACTADAAFYAYQRGLVDGAARAAVEGTARAAAADQDTESEFVPLAELIERADAGEVAVTFGYVEFRAGTRRLWEFRLTSQHEFDAWTRGVETGDEVLVPASKRKGVRPGDAVEVVLWADGVAAPLARNTVKAVAYAEALATEDGFALPSLRGDLTPPDMIDPATIVLPADAEALEHQLGRDGRPAGYVVVWSGGQRAGAFELYGDEFDRWAAAIEDGGEGVTVRAADYALVPGSLVWVSLHATDGGLIVHRREVVEDGPASAAGRIAVRGVTA